GRASGPKHFPGHGATTRDSHLHMPEVAADTGTLERRELVPFRAAIAAGASMVMTAHVRYPALDPTAPATISRPILTDLLRNELGFRGLCVTDSLDMGGIGEAGRVTAFAPALASAVEELADPIGYLEQALRRRFRDRLAFARDGAIPGGEGPLLVCSANATFKPEHAARVRELLAHGGVLCA